MTDPLTLYRDDGPLARSIAAALRPLGSVAQPLTIAVAAAPLFALIAVKGDRASHAAAAVALGWLVLVAGASAGRTPTGAFRWAVPALIRLSEYSALIFTSALAGEDSAAAAFALVCALAFRHYDLVYRLRHQGAAPPRWIGNLALGWDGRLVLGYILLVADALPAGFYIAAGLFAMAFVAESIAGWRRFGRGQQPVTYEDEED